MNRWRALLVMVLIVSLPASVLAQRPGAPAKETDIIEALGKVKLADLKKAVPRGTETRINPKPGSRLAGVGAVTRFTEPGGGVAYYFNRAGVLVSAQSKAQKPIPKATLMREIKGLQFKKYPPNQIAAAFVKRSPQVVQGFYLDKDERYVVFTSYDYLPR